MAKTLELTGGKTQLLGDLGDGQGTRQVLFHQKKRAADARIGDLFRHGRMGLGLGARTGAVEQQHLARLLRHRPADMTLDQMAGEVGGSRAARAGDAVAIRDEQAVGHHGLVGEFVQKVLIVVPADAGHAALHQAGAGQDEGAGAQARQLHAHIRRLLQVAFGRLIDLAPAMQQAADDHDIVKLARIDEVRGGRGQDAATGAQGVGPTGHHRPLHLQGATAIAFIGGEAQMVDEQGEGREGVVLGQDDADAQGRTMRGLGVCRVHGRVGHAIK